MSPLILMSPIDKYVSTMNTIIMGSYHQKEILGVFVSRIIDIETTGKNRTKLCKSILISIRELMKQSKPDKKSKDLTAFIILALQEIHAGIDPSVAAWEKRGYWVKADRFRMEWIWAERQAVSLEKALQGDDWGTIAQASIIIAEKLSNVKAPLRSPSSEFWSGAYNKLTE